MLFIFISNDKQIILIILIGIIVKSFIFKKLLFYAAISCILQGNRYAFYP